MDEAFFIFLFREKTGNRLFCEIMMKDEEIHIVIQENETSSATIAMYICCYSRLDAFKRHGMICSIRLHHLLHRI